MVTLRRAEPLAVEPVQLDDEQQAVLRYAGPALRVLGGPGTGKTVTAVELVVDRVHRGGLAPDQCLLLAPTRAAAAVLRERVTARLGATTTEPLARTHQAFGFGLLRREAALAGDPPPRLLSGPEQDVVLREMLAGHAELGSGPVWPQSLRAALTTRGFRVELRELLMRAVEHGLDAPALAELGDRHRRPEWVAAAAVLAEYDEVTALSRPGAYDPAWILTATAERLQDDPAALERVRSQLRLVVVDDAQELTSAAARLLSVLAAPAMQVVLVGDPDSAVQTFRGADPRLLVGQWPAIGDVATVVLRTAYRQPRRLHEVRGRVVTRIGATGGGAQRDTATDREGGQVEVALLRAVAQEGAHIASVLRRAHLLDGVAWAEMAVIVRGQGRGASLRRVLSAAGVPLAPPTTDLPVRDEVAVRPLLALLELCLRLARDPGALVTPTEAVDLLRSPVGGCDAVRLRRLRRHLRRAELDSGGGRCSDELLAAAVGDPEAVRGAGPEADPLRRLTRAVRAGAAAASRTPDGRGWSRGVTAEGVLWAIWSALELAVPWQREALRGGPRGARADHDLDAVVGLFDAAARFVDRLPTTGPDLFLDHILGEEVPGDTLVARAPATESVALLTPAAAAGRQWRLVVVAGVQEGVWPDLRLRGSLLGSEDLVDVVTGRPGTTRAAQAAVRYDETRLFHVAVTRATERLLVTAVRSDDEQPSVYLDLVDPVDTGADARPFTPVGRSMTMRGLVGQLRREVASADAAASRRSARLLARLAAEGVPGADPGSWWALVPQPADRARREPPALVRVSPSKVEQFARCALQWLLQASGADGPKSPSASIGTLVHDVAADLGDVDATVLQAEIDRRWPQLGLPPGWVNERKRAEAHAMARRLADYTASAQAQQWELIGAEVFVDVTVGRAALRGRVDRLERHTDTGALRVLDLKTGSGAPRKADLARHPQLGAYQVAVEHGAFAALGVESGGAALLQLGKAANKASVTLQQQLPLREADDPQWARDLIEATAEGMAGAVFPARPGEHCTLCAVRSSCPAAPEGKAI
ncbi:MAG: ATP-dependent helicase [Dermatophilaceae bacterium]